MLLVVPRRAQSPLPLPPRFGLRSRPAIGSQRQRSRRRRFDRSPVRRARRNLVQPGGRLCRGLLHGMRLRPPDLHGVPTPRRSADGMPQVVMPGRHLLPQAERLLCHVPVRFTRGARPVVLVRSRRLSDRCRLRGKRSKSVLQHRVALRLREPGREMRDRLRDIPRLRRRRNVRTRSSLLAALLRGSAAELPDQLHLRRGAVHPEFLP